MILLAAVASAAFAQVGMPPPQVQAAPPRPAAKPAAGRANAAAPSYKDLKYPPLHPPQFPPAVRFQLPNGMKLILVEDHETPLVTGTALVRTGSIYEAPEGAGLANLTGALIRSGGAGTKTPDQLDTELESLGASIDSNIGESLGTVVFSATRAKLAPVLALFHDVLTAPAFRSSRVDQAKAAAFNAIARRNDDPRQLLRREFLAAQYGKDSPVARRAEYAGVSRLHRSDIEAFYRRYFFPSNTLLVISGDFPANEMKDALETLFADWKSDQQPVPELPKIGAPEEAGSYLASRPQFRQSVLAFGRPAFTYRDRDAAALDVTAALLGWGAQSRLWLARGALASSINEIHAESTPGLGYPGEFVISAITMPGAAADVVKLAVDELQKLRSGEPSEEEVRIARDVVWLRACEGLDNRWRAALQEATAEYYGYPADYLQQYLKAVGAVTRADVLRVAKERLDPSKFTATVASNLRSFSDPRGIPTKPIDVTIAPPKDEPAATAAESTAEGKKLLQRGQQASGGLDRLAAVKDMTLKASYQLVGGGKDEEVDQWVAPSILRQDGDSTQFGRLIRFTDGTGGGWISNGYGSASLTGVMLRQMTADLIRSPISLLLSDRVAGRIVTAIDDETVEISQGNITVRVLFDVKTGLPSQMQYDVPGDRGLPTLFEEDYSDYRDVNGIQLPFRVVVRQNGEKFAEGVVSEIKLNQGLKAEVLQRRP